MLFLLILGIIQELGDQLNKVKAEKEKALKSLKTLKVNHDVSVSVLMAPRPAVNVKLKDIQWPVFFCSYLKCLEAEEQVKRNEFIARRFEQDVCQGILLASVCQHQSSKLVINRNIWRLNCYLLRSCSFLQALVFLFYVSFPSSATCELFLIKTIEMFSRS